MTDHDYELGLDVDLISISTEGLVVLIQQLEGGRHLGLRKRVQTELVERRRKKGFAL